MAMVHPVKIGRENRRFAAACPRPNFDNCISIFILVGRKEADLNFALEIANSFFQVGDFVVGHRRDLHVTGSGEFAIVVQLTPRCFELIPARKQFLDAGMFAHDFASTFAVVKQTRICDFAVELFEAFAFAFDEGIKIHNDVAAAVSAALGAGAQRTPLRQSKLSCLSARL